MYSAFINLVRLDLSKLDSPVMITYPKFFTEQVRGPVLGALLQN